MKKKTTTKAKKGLGDIVQTIAKPIAKAIDKVAGTDIENCKACEKRKEYLNTMFGNRPMREPTVADMALLEEYFTGYDGITTKYWQKTLLPINNRLFYRKDRGTSCAPCWAKIHGRLLTIYNSYNE